MGLEVAEQGVDFVFEAIFRRLLSEVRLVDVDVAEQEETVRAVAAAVVDQQRVTAELRRRDCIEVLRVDVVAMASEQELEVEGRGRSWRVPRVRSSVIARDSEPGFIRLTNKPID